MGSSRRRGQGVFADQEGYMVRSKNYRRSSQETWQVPSWEKKFCFSVGSVPWGKLLETKKYIYLYDSVVKWNDSAGEEAFNNAKSRFWAKINGLPCDISSPDPDIYIDDIDWDASIDPELFLDLEREPEPSDESNQGERVLILGDSHIDQPFSCTGWGDAEEVFQKGNEAQNPGGTDDQKNPWEQSCEWGNKDIRGDQQGWGHNSNGWGKGFDHWGNNYGNSGRVYGDHWGTLGTHNWNKDGSGWNNSRYKASRFPGDDYRTADHGWRDSSGRRKGVNVAYEKHALRQWNVKSSAPVV
ncbi:hypothetical protein L484_015495 [Morus notabilis]|uniref:Uncharacterized protein n=1 Tax=Morus notabilis TaxID=981085 RepID=W9RIT1_9ROSA|nr:uncharacterized protein LOC21398589 [Morus notabilis]EXB93950.1 hypothetical protein L484_015495 [Morus notabilis]